MPAVLPTGDTNQTRVYRYLDSERDQQDTRRGLATAGSQWPPWAGPLSLGIQEILLMGSSLSS